MANHSQRLHPRSGPMHLRLGSGLVQLRLRDLPERGDGRVRATDTDHHNDDLDDFDQLPGCPGRGLYW